MQAHSCKTGAGTDEQFEPLDGAVVGRADAEGRCVQAHSAASSSGFDAQLCDNTEALQRFEWNATAGSLVLEGSSLCIVVGESVRSANQYYARDLLLAECDATSAALKTWEVNGAGDEPEDSAASLVCSAARQMLLLACVAACLLERWS